MSKDTRRFVRRSPDYYSDFHFIDSYVSANLHCTLASDHVCCICVTKRRQCPPWKIERIYEDLALFLSLSLFLFPFTSISYSCIFLWSIVRIPRGFSKIAMLLRKTRLSRVPWGLPMNVNSGKCRLNTEAFVNIERTRASWKFMSTPRIAI